MNEAVIIAGGRGERLRPLTDTSPKPLLDVGGRPVIEWQIAQLEDAGVERIAIVGYYLFQQIQQYIESREGSARVVLVREGRPLGRGGAFRLGWRALGSPDLLFGLNGNVLTDASPRELELQRRRTAAAAVLLAVPLRSTYGVVEIEGQFATRFREKPVLDHWINGGLYALSAEAISAFPEVGDHEDVAFPQLAARRRIAVHCHRGIWQSIDSPKDLEAARELVGNLRFGDHVGV